MGGSKGMRSAGVPVGIPSAIQRTPASVVVRPTGMAWLWRDIVRPLWMRRRELILTGLVAVMTAAWALPLLDRYGPQTGSVMTAGCAVATVLAVLGAWSVATRRSALAALGGWVEVGQVRREFDRAARHAGVATHNDRVPRVKEVDANPAGHRLRVRIPAGSSAEELAGAAEEVAVVLRAREVRVTREPEDASTAYVDVIRTDPLAGDSKPWPWQNRPPGSVSFWEPIPVAVAELGGTVDVTLPGSSLLIGGEPGAGKSVAAQQILAAAALAGSSVRTWLFDPKHVELAMWKDTAHRFMAGDEPIDVLQVLKELHAEMLRRYRWLANQGGRKITARTGFPVELMFIDELAVYTQHPDKKRRDEMTRLVRDIIARGRAAAVVPVLATQKPAADVVPSSLRDLVAMRWALRCTTPDASDTILGSGMAGAGWSADSIDLGSPGVGLLRAEGLTPQRCRAHWQSDADLEDIAGRVARVKPACGRWRKETKQRDEKKGTTKKP